ncbi:extracellular solute-binding protein [Actinoplanes sp. NPDC051411]|uniref:ABC transporter substrate-binding protein n=1 Tax=Actinoplanes sp. NPDC051411 TaxID=3155522 RepID=UPI00341C541F
MHNGNAIRTRRTLTSLAGLAGLALAITVSGCSAGSLGDSGSDGKTTVTLLADNGAGTIISTALAKAFNASQSGVEVKVETRPGGSDGDNLVKTRLSTNSMADVFLYNTGSLFQQINPGRYLQPLDADVTSKLADSFTPQVSAGAQVFGVPIGTANAGGILYNIPIYQRLKLKVPTTWDEFIANSQKIKAAGIDPVIQTYGGSDTWTAQLPVLADFHNVAVADPSFAQDYTDNKVKFATTPAALAGFQHLQQIHQLGLQNKDYAAATNAQGLTDLAIGKGAQYPMLSSLLSTLQQNNPDKVQDIGFFAQPGNDPATNGATVWSPNGLYIPKSTTGAKLDAVKKLLAYAVTQPACDAESKAATPTGPYQVKGCTLPADVPQVTKDVAAYFDSGKTTPALEFLSPVKGPNLENFCVQAGSGIADAQKAAKLYDQDVTKQAQQLGLKGW